ncbi:MAG: hypothetical protein Q7O66_00595 [Dehalococcoidia bacterium]|nr:hypothetical protein [Dehalococcoidia bacterium]
MSGADILVLDPTGVTKASGLQLAPRPADLEGKTVGLLDNGQWWSFGVVLQHYRKVLKERFGVSDVISINILKEGFQTFFPKSAEELVGKVDVVMNGLGN